MSYFLGLAAAALALLAAALAFGRAIARNVRVGEEYYHRLAVRLNALRLSRALRLFGLDRDQYLRSQPVVDAERQMRNCAGCTDTKTCDDCLNAEDCSERFQFCPNYEFLAKHRESV